MSVSPNSKKLSNKDKDRRFSSYVDSGSQKMTTTYPSRATVHSSESGVALPPTTGVDITEAVITMPSVHDIELLRLYLQKNVPGPGERFDFKDLLYQRPLFNEFEQSSIEWGLLRLLEVFAPDKKLFPLVLSAVILEQPLVLYSCDLSLLSCVLLCLPILLRPFEYHQPVIQILPEALFAILEAPVPFIVGINRLPDDYEIMAAQTILIDLDRQMLIPPTNPTHPLLPNIDALQKVLKPCCRTLTSTIDMLRDNCLVSLTQANVLHIVELLFQDFFSALFNPLLLRLHSIRDLSGDSPVSVFIKDSFILQVDKATEPFWRQFFDTQIFLQFSDATLRQLDSSETRETAAAECAQVPIQPSELRTTASH